MADPVRFVIQEIQAAKPDQAAASSGVAADGVRFEWTIEGRSMPVEGWPGGVTVQASREVDPGSDDVVHQVLAAPLKPFTLSGSWDDRHNDEGFAARTLADFQALVRRANLVRIEHAGRFVVGLIDDFDFNGRTSWRVDYTFRVSPESDQSSRPRRRWDRPPKSPADFEADAAAALAAIALAHTAAPVDALTGTVYADAQAAVQAVGAAAVAIQSAIATRLDTLEALVATSRDRTGAPRVIQAFVDAAEAGIDLARLAAALDPTTALAYETAIVAVRFDEWSLGLQTSGRLLRAAAAAAAEDLARRLAPDAAVLYRARGGETLGGISARIYRTPHRALDLMRRNGLRSPVLAGGELLVIPV